MAVTAGRVITAGRRDRLSQGSVGGLVGRGGLQNRSPRRALRPRRGAEPRQGGLRRLRGPSGVSRRCLGQPGGVWRLGRDDRAGAARPAAPATERNVLAATARGGPARARTRPPPARRWLTLTQAAVKPGPRDRLSRRRWLARGLRRHWLRLGRAPPRVARPDRARHPRARPPRPLGHRDGRW